MQKTQSSFIGLLLASSIFLVGCSGSSGPTYSNVDDQLSFSYPNELGTVTREVVNDARYTSPRTMITFSDSDISISIEQFETEESLQLRPEIPWANTDDSMVRDIGGWSTYDGLINFSESFVDNVRLGFGLVEMQLMMSETPSLETVVIVREEAGTVGGSSPPTSVHYIFPHPANASLRVTVYGLPESEQIISDIVTSVSVP